MARLELATLTRTITADALAHPTDLGPMLARRHSVSRGTMTKQLKRLVESGWLERNGVTRPQFKPGVQREVTTEYAVEGLDELVATTPDAFAEIALRLVDDGAWGAHLEREIAQRRHALFEAAGVAKPH